MPGLCIRFLILPGALLLAHFSVIDCKGSQISNILPASMSQSKALILLCHRTQEKAAYMMWPCSNRWAIFCHWEGIDAALSTLQAMVQDLQVPSCTNRHPEAAVGHQSCLPKYTPFAYSRHEILRLLHVVWTSKSGEWEGVARSRTCEQLIHAFALP